MDRSVLRKAQLVQLDIAKEIMRVCEKNNIKFFLDSGSMLGAIRHKGFIPWDDDFDIGMLREDYDKFSGIASQELSDDYYWQTWSNEDHYALPFGKVRKKNTLYLEKRSPLLNENGFWVDVLPYDNAPVDDKEWKRLWRKHTTLYSCLLVKEKYEPWIFNGKINFKKRIHFLYYQLLSTFYSRDQLIKKYEELTAKVIPQGLVYQQTGTRRYKIDWFNETVKVDFEDVQMPVLANYDEWLTTAYGDYMTPPPVEKRENMHEICKVEF